MKKILEKTKAKAKYLPRRLVTGGRQIWQENKCGAI